MTVHKKINNKPPLLLEPNFDNIPDKLKKYPLWAVWKGVPRKNGKLDKPPTNPVTGKYAKVNDPTTFGSFEDAKSAYLAGGYDGVGVLISKQKKILGIDLDECVFEGNLSIEARAIVEDLGTYSELSPSGTGIHCIGRSKDAISINVCKKDGIEFYTDARFLTITGHQINYIPVNFCGKAFLKLHSSIFIGKNTGSSDRAMDAIRATKLFGGDWSEFGSESEGDLALCRNFISNGITTPEEIDKMFRKSGLMDEKWERSDYRDGTINKAITLEARQPRSTNSVITLLNTLEMITSPPPDIPWVLISVE